MASLSSRRGTEPESSVIAEQARLAALQSLQLLDTAPEQVFEDAVRLASTICGTPISLVSLIDGHRQWFKARVGLEMSETPREQAFCAHAIQQSDLFIVPDALLDTRFKQNPLVTGDPKIRFYAGMPLKSPDGHAIGTLCVIDSKPRQLTPEQEAALAVLTEQVSNQIRLRAQVKYLSETLIENTRFHKEICDSNGLFHAFMDNSPLLSYMKDEHGRMVYYNRLFADRFNVTPEEWVGKVDSEIWPSASLSSRDVDQAVLKNGKLVVTEETFHGPGTCTHWRSYKFPFVDASGERYVANMSLDTSFEKEAELELKRSHEELFQANERLRELSVTDALTGLYNRRGFNDRIEQEIASAKRYGLDFSMFLIDIDDFKSLNDSFGHEEGDEVLRSIAALLQQGARASDTVYRYGGEEFAVLLPSTTLQAAVRLGDRIRLSIEMAPWKRRRVTVSIGASTNKPGWCDAATLVRRADMALYEAKGRGKNRVDAYRPELEAVSPASVK